MIHSQAVLQQGNLQSQQMTFWSTLKHEQERWSEARGSTDTGCIPAKHQASAKQQHIPNSEALGGEMPICHLQLYY